MRRLRMLPCRELLSGGYDLQNRRCGHGITSPHVPIGEHRRLARFALTRPPWNALRE